jgi:hypothetical protein
MVEADRRMEHHRKFVKRMENARTSSLQRFNNLPENATIRKEYVTCGKYDCQMSHGPYYYAYWKERISSCDNQFVTVCKLKKKYIGTYLPETGKSKISTKSGT